MIAELIKLTSDGERAIYRLEIPGSHDRLIEVGPADMAACRCDLNDAALKKAGELIEYLELAEFAMVRLRTN